MTNGFVCIVLIGFFWAVNPLILKVISTGFCIVGAQSAKLESIQLLRFIAAFAVVCVHIPLLGGGGFGVDIFFFISGFIISYISTFDQRNFFKKRIIRIVPIYWLLTLSVFTLALLAPSLLNNTTADPVHLLKSLFFVPFDKNGSGLFPVLFVGWTLNYEMFFYLVFGLSMMISHKYRELLASAALALIFVGAQFFPQDSVVYNFLGHSILLEFIFGMLFRLLWSHLQERSEKHVSLAGIIFGLCFLTFLVGLIITNPTYITDSGEHIQASLRALIWGVPSALLCMSVILLMSKARIPAFLILLGDASFSLYLLHAYPLQAFDKILGVYDKSIVIAWGATLVALAIIIGLSIVFYKLIEKPATLYLRQKFVR